MKDLRYIVIDYGRYKDIESIFRFKRMWKASLLLKIYTIFYAMLIVASLWAAVHCKPLIIVLLIVAFISLLPLFIQQEERFSIFGAFPRCRALVSKSLEKKGEVVPLDQNEEKIVERNNPTVDVPEWFERFLEEKGIDKYNVDLLIAELKESYDYPVLKKGIKWIAWVVAFVGYHGFKEIPWTIELIAIVLVAFIAYATLIVAIEEHYKSKKEKIHPVIFMKRKEEFLRDLNLMKMKWNA